MSIHRLYKNQAADKKTRTPTNKSHRASSEKHERPLLPGEELEEVNCLLKSPWDEGTVVNTETFGRSYRCCNQP